MTPQQVGVISQTACGSGRRTERMSAYAAWCVAGAALAATASRHPQNWRWRRAITRFGAEHALFAACGSALAEALLSEGMRKKSTSRM